VDGSGHATSSITISHAGSIHYPNNWYIPGWGGKQNNNAINLLVGGGDVQIHNG